MSNRRGHSSTGSESSLSQSPKRHCFDSNTSSDTIEMNAPVETTPARLDLLKSLQNKQRQSSLSQLSPEYCNPIHGDSANIVNNNNNRTADMYTEDDAATKAPCPSQSMNALMNSTMNALSTITEGNSDKFAEQIIERLEKLQLTTDAIKQSVETNTSSISELKQALQQVSNESKTSLNIAQKTEQKNLELKLELSIMSTKMTRLETQVEKLSGKVTDVQCREMRENIVIQNLEEQAREDPYQAVMDFLVNVMKVPSEDIWSHENTGGYITIDVCHRIGKFHPDAKRARPMIVRSDNRRSKNMLMSFCRNLAGTRYSVSDQFPDEVRSRRSAQVDQLKSLRSSGQIAKLSVDKLIVNGRPMAADFSLNCLSNQSANLEHHLQSGTETQRLVEQGSTFIAYANAVGSVEDANTALQRISGQSIMTNVTHITYAYRINSKGSITEGFDDNGEYGLGRKLLRSIANYDNIFVAIARWHNGPNLGYKRFEIAITLARDAINVLAK